MTEPVTTLPVTIPGGVVPSGDDLVWVFLDGHLLMEGQDYTRAADGQSIAFTAPIQPSPVGAPARVVAIQTQTQTVVGSGEQPADILLDTIRSIGQPNGLATLDNTGKLVQMPTAADVGARPNTWMPTAADVGAMSANAIESGSNSNGTYVKYPDGTMICFGSFATGSCPPGQIIGTQSKNYPVAFVGVPVMTLLARADTTTGTALAYLGSNTSGAWWGYAQNNTDTARAISIHWTAIGRWK